MVGLTECWPLVDLIEICRHGINSALPCISIHYHALPCRDGTGLRRTVIKMKRLLTLKWPLIGVALMAVLLFPGIRCGRQTVVEFRCDDPANAPGQFVPGTRSGTDDFNKALGQIRECLNQVKNPLGASNPSCLNPNCLCVLLCWLSMSPGDPYWNGCDPGATHAVLCEDECIMFVICAGPPLPFHMAPDHQIAQKTEGDRTALQAAVIASLIDAGENGDSIYSSNCWHS